MTLINALLKFGPGAEIVEFRLHLRYEFLMLGIIPLFDKLHEYENDDLNLHVNVFKLQRERDEQVLRDNVKDKVNLYKNH
jgi:dishevelled associated activator of morphogenesis